MDSKDFEAFEEIKAKNEEIKKEQTFLSSNEIEISFSTEGKLYAPKSIRLRDLGTKELLDLSMTRTEDLPVKIIGFINSLIVGNEPNKVTIDAGEFSEKEIEEALLYFFLSFYSASIEDVEYNVTDEDKKWMRENELKGNPEAYSEWLAGVEGGQIKYNFTITPDMIKFHECPEDFDKHNKAKVYSRDRSFSAVFRILRYNEGLSINEYVKEKFASQESRFENTKRMIEARDDAEKKIALGQPATRIYVPEKEERDYNEYIKERFSTEVLLAKAASLYEFDGKNVDDLEFAEKVKLAMDNRITHVMYQTAAKMLKDLKYGVIDKVHIVNPVTHKEMDYEYPFRLFNILQAFRSIDNNRSDGELV